MFEKVERLDEDSPPTRSLIYLLVLTEQQNTLIPPPYSWGHHSILYLLQKQLGTYSDLCQTHWG
jgi:hypothetical protein